jgi:hypothetical protein
MSITRYQRTRDALLRRISHLARRALFGSLSETYRTCGRPGCRCHQGHRHGPHLYVSFRGPDGTTTGYYVPQHLAEAMREGVVAWQQLQQGLRQLAEVNRQRLWARKAARGLRRSQGSSPTRAAQHLRNDPARRGSMVGPRAAAYP